MFQKFYLRDPSNRSAIVSRKVFCGASKPFLISLPKIGNLNLFADNFENYGLWQNITAVPKY